MFEDTPILVDHTECYYCGKEVTSDYEWNAVRDEIHHRWKCHGKCMDREKVEIVISKDWERGEAYSIRHALNNPIGSGLSILRCGCQVSTTKFMPDGEWYLGGMWEFCPKHLRTIKMRYLNYGGAGHAKAHELHEKWFKGIREATGLRQTEDYWKEYYEKNPVR